MISLTIRNILNFGTSTVENTLDKEYIRITNIINLLFIFAVAIPLFFLIISLSTDGLKSFSRVFLLIGLAIVGLLLNKFNFTLLSKIITSAYPPLIIIVFPIFVTGFVHTGMFFWIPYALMTFGIIPFFIFSFEKEKTEMATVILLYLVAIIAFDEFLMIRFNQLPDLIFITKYHIYYSLSKIIISIFLYTSFFFFKYAYHKNRMQLFLITDELNKKNQTLNILNSTLELKVIERTEKITVQNNRIKQLAHMNAHEIRAYILRIKGLFNISKLESTNEEKAFYDKKITENITALENITIKISDDLIEEQ